MNEWTVVTAIVVLVGLISAVASPVVKLNTTLAKLNTTVDTLEKDVEAMKQRNAQGHNQIWESNKEQDKQLADLSVRLAVMEKSQKYEKPNG